MTLVGRIPSLARNLTTCLTGPICQTTRARSSLGAYPNLVVSFKAQTAGEARDYFSELAGIRKYPLVSKIGIDIDNQDNTVETAQILGELARMDYHTLSHNTILPMGFGTLLANDNEKIYRLLAREGIEALELRPDETLENPEQVKEILRKLAFFGKAGTELIIHGSNGIDKSNNPFSPVTRRIMSSFKVGGYFYQSDVDPRRATSGRLATEVVREWNEGAEWIGLEFDKDNIGAAFYLLEMTQKAFIEERNQAIGFGR